jgi:hypothetical protein
VPPVTLASNSKVAGAIPSVSLGMISTAVRGGGGSTVISILSDAVRPVESVTRTLTLYVSAMSNVCSPPSSFSSSVIPSPKSHLIL